jgi:hypothetical protein
MLRDSGNFENNAHQVNGPATVSTQIKCRRKCILICTPKFVGARRQVRRELRVQQITEVAVATFAKHGKEVGVIQGVNCG